jgi:hypothetical protein
MNGLNKTVSLSHTRNVIATNTGVNGFSTLGGGHNPWRALNNWGGYMILRPQSSKYWGDVTLASPVALTPMATNRELFSENLAYKRSIAMVCFVQ